MVAPNSRFGGWFPHFLCVLLWMGPFVTGSCITGSPGSSSLRFLCVMGDPGAPSAVWRVPPTLFGHGFFEASGITFWITEMWARLVSYCPQIQWAHSLKKNKTQQKTPQNVGLHLSVLTDLKVIDRAIVASGLLEEDHLLPHCLFLGKTVFCASHFHGLQFFCQKPSNSSCK